MLGFVALFIPIVDDAPIDFDWPRLTGFPPGLFHYTMQVYLYEASIAFFLLSFGLAVWRYHPDVLRSLLAFVLVFFSFIAGYAGDIPLKSIRNIVARNWYALYTVDHVTATIVFGLAVLVCWKSRAAQRAIRSITTS
jgi:hypothetical protein